MNPPELRVTERLSATAGMITLSGAQALMRIPVDQHRIDAASGSRLATLVSGYRGSPLGGVEGIVAQHKAVLDAADVHFISGVNEELAATAVWGSQMSTLEANPRFDGVLGLWYGKGPGVDRSGDAFRHGNFAGVHPKGGVLALAGDDPECKSSTIPSASEFALHDAGMPVVYPGDVADVLRLGRFGVELSRASGLWVGFKVHTDVADGFATIPASSADVDISPFVYEVDGEPWRHTVNNNLLAPHSLMLEEELFGHRTQAALGFARENSLDRSYGASDAWLGIVVAGKPHGDVRDALKLLGIDGQLDDLGVRVYVPGLISPLEPQGLRAFAQGLESILVVEAKRPFIETQVRDLLYDNPDRPNVYGKFDLERERLIPIAGALSGTTLVEPLRRVLTTKVDASRLARQRQRIPLLGDSGLPGRTPYYCSGCPHNTSTTAPEGSLVGGGIGCHSMVLWMDRSTVGLTQMGGEGAQWVGTAPFVHDPHRFQNLGDGTFFHSGSLAIRQAVAAETNITFKLLYNGVVAMTGGQDAAGEMPVPELTRWLDAEGVVATVVVTDHVDKYGSNADFAAGCRVVDRAEFDDVQRELRDIPGVTALVYDQGCAADLRRRRKRGTIDTPTTRVMINEAICEGCGHCGEVSNCMSVHPVETPFGRKTQIHQESCNLDLSCLGGNCPAFVTVEIDPDDAVVADTPGAAYGVGEAPSEPLRPREASLLIVGIGGTGVVTVSQVLSTAAMLDDLVATSLDQTGLAQKGGQVVSNLRIGPKSYEGAAKVGAGDADTLLLFDMVGGSQPKVLERGDPESTVAIVSTTQVPTGQMVTSLEHENFPEADRFRRAIDAATRDTSNRYIDAEAIARYVFASQPAANLLVTGMAYQLGRIPVSAASIETAIGLNGVAVDMNVAAFTLGRRLMADADLLEEIVHASKPNRVPPPFPDAQTQRMLDEVPYLTEELAEVLHWRIPELIEWGDVGTARTYVHDIAAVRRAELSAGIEGAPLSTVAARHLFHLMAYKDEYEVARLALSADMEAKAKARFGPNAKLSYQLKPPSLKKVGVDRKVAIPEKAARKTFRSLLKTKKLRGTRLDPFGRSEERRIERELIGEYRDLLVQLSSGLDADNVGEAVEIAELADMIRGFDEVKLANVARYREAVSARLAKS